MIRSGASTTLQFSLAFCLTLCGCAKPYLMRIPTNALASPTVASTRPECKAYRLFNAGLGYIPFDQVGGQCGEFHSVDAAILLEPGMKLRLSQFALVGDTTKEPRLSGSPSPMQDLQISQVPTVSQFEWIKPGPSTLLSRADFFLLSYLAAASFPTERRFDGCAPPQCDARAALQSLRVFYGIGIQNPPNAEASAAWLREILNPSSYSDTRSIQSLGLILNKTAMKTFDQWDDPWFVSGPIDENNEAHGSSSLYREGYRIYTGHALAEIQIPIRVSDSQIPSYVPVYWSIEDAEKELGLTVIGIRRRTCYLTDTSLNYLVPTARRVDVSSAPGGATMSCMTDRDSLPSLVPQTYFTLWFKKPSWAETKKLRNWGAHGYVVLSKDASHDTSVILDAKKKMLLAPSDVLLLAR